MIYCDLSPESEVAATVAPSRPGRPALSPKRSRRRKNLLKQLVDPTVVAETAGLLEQQAGDIYSAFKPRNGWQDWLTSTVATIMLRINRSERIERKLRDYASYRAIDFWEDDQKLAVETLALKIAREPARVVATLRETPVGIDWLIARWRMLAQVDPQSWNEEQRKLANRLIGEEGAVDPWRVGFAAEQIAALVCLRERVVEADAIVRSLVEADLHDDAVPGLARFRRYVRSLHRQLKWYVDQFHVEHPDRWDDPRRRPASYGPVVDEYRPQNPNHFEGAKPSGFAKTNPMPVAVDILEGDETKPTPTTTAHGTDKTKPIERAAHQNDKTKPIERAAHQNDKTKPIDLTAHKNEETKPIDLTECESTVWGRFDVGPPVVAPGDSTDRKAPQNRSTHASDRSRDDARRQKAARRRSNLALAESL